jgi:hypothetical protein
MCFFFVLYIQALQEIRLLTKSFASRRRNASVLQELLQVLGKHISVVLAIDGCNDALHCNSALPG